VSLRERLAQRRRMGSLGLADEYDFEANRTVDDYLAPGLAPTAAPAAPDMAFDISETEPNDAYQTALAASRQELSAPIAAPGLAPPPPNVPAPAVAGAPVSPPPVQAPTGAGALPTAAAPLVVPPNPAAPPQGIPAIQAQANQRQQPMQAPPQPPQPVTPAPAPTEVASANEVFAGAPVSAPGLAAPQAPPQAKDTARSDKMLGRAASGLQGYAMAPEERAALEDARQGDRRMRIAQGVLGGLGGVLGMVGLGTGNRALAGVGAGVSQVGRVIPQGRRAAEVLADYDRRRESLGQQQTAESRAQQLRIESDRIGVQQLGAQANMVRAQGQAQLDQANVYEMELERARSAGDAEAVREIVRGRVRGMPAGPDRDAMARATAPGSQFDQLDDVEALLETARIVESMDPQGARAAAAAGQARRPTGHWENDANGNAHWIETGGGGGGRPRAPVPVDPYAQFNTNGPAVTVAGPGQTPNATQGAPMPAPADAAAPAPAPAGRPAARRRRPTEAAPAAAPVPAGATPTASGTALAPAPGNIIETGHQAEVSDFERLMHLQGLTPQDEAWTLNRNGFIRDITSGDEVRSRAAITLMRTRLDQASVAQAGDMPVGIPPAMRGDWDQFRARVIPYDRAANAGYEAANALELLQQSNPDAFRAAVAFTGNESVPLTGAALRIRSRINRILNQKLHELSGAAVTPPEYARIASSMGTGSLVWAGSPETIISVMRSGARSAASAFDREAGTFDRRIRDGYANRAYGGNQ
jgi:hypothetical protein